MEKEYLKSSEEILQELQTSHQGLTDQQAETRLAQYGENRLQEGRKTTMLERFVEELKDPMLIMLMAAAAVSAITNIISHEPLTEVFIIIAVVLLNAVLGVFQESKAEEAIEALQKMTAAECKVLRNGSMKIIENTKLVPGDIVMLEAGDAVPADGRLLEARSLKIEEAALTGESVPVNKMIDLLYLQEGEKEVALGDRTNMVYMGSSVVYGRGLAVITDTGMTTEMGKIADALNDTQQEETPLQKKLSDLGKKLSWLVIGICIFIFVFDLIQAGSFSLSTILETFMVAVSLAVAAIPEGLATVVTVVLSIGVTKMSKSHAVIRRLTAVETLGCTQTICSDKTGTLTRNQMTAVEHTGDREMLASAMALCSDAMLNTDGTIEGEPTEAALVAFARDSGLNKYDLEKQMPRVEEAPFDSTRKMMTTIHQRNDGTWISFTKGAPDAVISLCTQKHENGRAVAMTKADREAAVYDNKNMADRALRVLCAAYRIYDEMPQDTEPQALEKDLTYIGLVGMIDPVRDEVIPAIQQCRNAGIRPVMITGDHKDTAVAIGKQIGIIKDESEAVTGAQLDEMSDEQLEADITKYGVYARVKPEHKVRIVTAWKKRGAITAMTGDGVNDAPSIKTADIGIGMGITGTDVTKNVADMILTDDNFATIVNAVEEGRKIYDNIRKAVQFLLSSNMSEVIGVFVSSLMGFTLLKPVHLLFINLITDCLPALALGVEEAEENIMKRKPRDAEDSIFADGMIYDVIYQGGLIAGLTVLSYLLGHYFETGIFEIPHVISPHGMTMAFLTMNMCEIFHSWNLRSLRGSIFSLKSHNRLMWISMIAAAAIVTVVLEVPFVAGMFGFTPVGFVEYGTAICLAFLVIPIVETVKFIQRKTK
ncbi:MAG: cation-translocating P-type ATPase [Erysipelotrichaceae bacterium]|nr:cation-translocating P-type ATPase [Erysipelotrichaceae bacterium]